MTEKQHRTLCWVWALMLGAFMLWGLL